MFARLRNWLPPFLAAEIGPLLAIVAAAGAGWGFIAIADEVGEGSTHAFDEAVLLAFRSPADPADPLGPQWLEIAVRDFTALGSTAVLALVTLVAALYLIMDGRRAAALFVLVAIAGGTALSFGLKIGFERPRPDLVPHHADVYTLSFPSGHAMMSAATYLTLGALLARTQSRRRMKAYVLAVAMLLTALVGLSRIYLGVHWPTDVFAGWCAGAAWALLCWAVALFLQREGRIEPTRAETGGTESVT